MGTMIQTYKLDEAAYRGERFKDWHKDVKNFNDLLNFTRRRVIEEVHRKFLDAGAEITETNPFNSQAVSLADYEMQTLGYDLPKAGGECARRAADAVMQEKPG